MIPLRVLLVDDEPLSRERLRRLLLLEAAERGPVEIAECDGGRAAISALSEGVFDLLLLDVQMPEIDGWEVLSQVGPALCPLLVFVTAYDRHALRAFEADAVDYLLKPFDRERFMRTMERVRARLPGRRAQSPPLLSRIVCRTAGRAYFLRPEEIDWIESDGNYTKLHIRTDSHLLRGTLRGLEARLDPACFLRIHRGIIVNLDRVREVQPFFGGDYVVVLQDGTKLTSGRGYRGQLRRLLQMAG